MARRQINRSLMRQAREDPGLPRSLLGITQEDLRRTRPLRPERIMLMYVFEI